MEKDFHPRKRKGKRCLKNCGKKTAFPQPKFVNFFATHSHICVFYNVKKIVYKFCLTGSRSQSCREFILEVMSRMVEAIFWSVLTSSSTFRMEERTVE